MTLKHRAKTKTQETDVSPSKEAAAETPEIEDLIDEIDRVLEKNAEEFVRGFQQKGGE